MKGFFFSASVQDANYGVRWLKWKASSWNGDASKIGIYGSSSGGHVAELLAMRPNDPRYNAIPLTDDGGKPVGGGKPSTFAQGASADKSGLPDLRWEPSRGGALFPHLYADLPFTAVLWAEPLNSALLTLN